MPAGTTVAGGCSVGATAGGSMLAAADPPATPSSPPAAAGEGAVIPSTVSQAEQSVPETATESGACGVRAREETPPGSFTGTGSLEAARKQTREAQTRQGKGLLIMLLVWKSGTHQEGLPW